MSFKLGFICLVYTGHALMHERVISGVYPGLYPLDIVDYILDSLELCVWDIRWVISGDISWNMDRFHSQIPNIT